MRIELTYSGRYKLHGTPAELLRTGVISRTTTNKAGLTHAMSGLQMDGTARCFLRADKAIANDQRFRAAMDHVLHGTACPDFNLPAATRQRRRERR